MSREHGVREKNPPENSGRFKPSQGASAVLLKPVRSLAARVLRAVGRRSDGGVELDVRWFRRDQRSWLAGYLADTPVRPAPCPRSTEIEALAARADAAGPRPLWEGYERVKRYPMPVKNAVRRPGQVRVARRYGELFCDLARSRQPELIVEFGTAFGVSGMYWLAGLEAAGTGGRLLTFEPNPIWAAAARENLSQISGDFELTVGTFEDNIAAAHPPGASIELAFIDAIHTSDFVVPQFEILEQRMPAGGIIVLDDIRFSRDMYRCWKRLARASRVATSAEVGPRIGILELAAQDGTDERPGRADP